MRDPDKDTRSAGFTLIEVMIGLVIAMLVIGVATSFYQHTIRENLKIKDSAMLQQSAFFTAYIANQHLRQAGYKGIDASMINGRLMPIPANDDIFPEVTGEWEQGQFIRVANNTIGIRFNGSSDISGVADGSIIDCSGNPVAAGTIQDVALQLTGDQLICTSGGVAETLLGGDNLAVSTMIINLGIDDEADGSIDRYEDPASISTDDLALVREVLIRLLMVSNRNLDATGRSYRFNNTDIVYTDDQYRREVVIRTALRNQ